MHWCSTKNNDVVIDVTKIVDCGVFCDLHFVDC